MADKPSLEEILKRNPHIDRQDAERLMEELRRLRQSPYRRKGYDLAPLYGGRRVSAMDDHGSISHSARTKPKS